MTSSQILEVVYEGMTRRFTISRVSQNSTNAESRSANLADDLQAMSIRSSSQLWTVGWDAIVSIAETSIQVTNPVDQRLDAASPSKHQNQETYTSVGGLEKQISQIRDLLEIPLTHPELFQHFGMLSRPCADCQRLSLQHL
jgi:AAA family ATPase